MRDILDRDLAYLKPYAPDVFMAKIRAVIDARAPSL